MEITQQMHNYFEMLCAVLDWEKQGWITKADTAKIKAILRKYIG